MALQQLDTALQSLSDTVSNFNVGAISIADFKPIEAKLADMRQILKVQGGHSLLLTAKQDSRTFAGRTQEDISTLVTNLHEKITNLQITNVAINLALHSCAINEIVCENKPTLEFKKQVQNCMRKLYMLNDTLTSYQTPMTEASENGIQLNIESKKSLFEYREFLKEQEDFRNKKLQETNPQILKNKKKLEDKITKINLMKRLMTNMIAASGDFVITKPFLFEMMKKHRELLNIETIIEMGRNATESPDRS